MKKQLINNLKNKKQRKFNTVILYVTKDQWFKFALLKKYLIY